jgi:hypothetical protein
MLVKAYYYTMEKRTEETVDEWLDELLQKRTEFCASAKEVTPSSSNRAGIAHSVQYRAG